MIKIQYEQKHLLNDLVENLSIVISSKKLMKHKNYNAMPVNSFLGIN